jgi:hypothetical protein
MIRLDRCHSGGKSVSNYLMQRIGRKHGDHPDFEGGVGLMCVTDTADGRAGAIGSVTACRLGRDLLVKES